MKVNAQVTVVITTLETLGNFFNFIVWSVSAKIMGDHPSLLTLIQAMLLNFVFLPYTFLMNTRYNKNRIIEGGWKVVLQNMKTSSKKKIQSLSSEKADNTSEGERSLARHSKDDFGLETLNLAKPRHWKYRKNRVQPSVYVIEYDNTSMKEVCTISFEKDLLSFTTGYLPEERSNTVLTDTTSLHDNMVEDDLPQCSFSLEEATTNPDINQSLTPAQIKDFTIVRTKLLRDLQTNVEIERLYVLNLMRLIRLEEALKNNEEIETLDYKDEDDVFQNMPHFVGSLERKVYLRTEKIQALTVNKENEMKYNELIEELINMEESFVDNGC